MVTYSDLDILHSLLTENPVFDPSGLEVLDSHDIPLSKIVQPNSWENPILKGWEMTASIHGPIKSEEHLKSKYGWAIKRELTDLDSNEGEIISPGSHVIFMGMLKPRSQKRFKKRTDGKSSLGRIFVESETKSTEFNNVIPEGFNGDMMFQVSPQRFAFRARVGDVFNQVRETDDIPLDKTSLELGLGTFFGIYDTSGNRVSKKDVIGGNYLRMPMIFEGWQTEVCRDAIDLRREDHDPELYFSAIKSHNGYLTISPDRSYILGTRDGIFMSPRVCGHMKPSLRESGKLTPHKTAGFIDCGFGSDGTPRTSEELDDIVSYVDDITSRLNFKGAEKFKQSIQDEMNRIGNPITRKRGNRVTCEVDCPDTMILEQGSFMETHIEVESVGVNYPVARPYGMSSTLGSNYANQRMQMLGKFYQKFGKPLRVA